MMRVAYLINQYPKVSHTFIRREIRALEAMGVEVLRHSVRGTPDELIDPADLHEEEQTRILLGDGAAPLLAATAQVSASDQYVARLGVQMGPASWKGWSAGLGGRIEGIPVHDVFGSSYGRRRPGYMISIEPSVNWSRGPHTVSFAMPWAVERNRQRSVSDLMRGTHGDAAFPDYLLRASYSHRF